MRAKDVYRAGDKEKPEAYVYEAVRLKAGRFYG
jgi:hypothetical protein